MKSLHRWYKAHGCPTINEDYSYGPQPVSKEAEVTLSSDSDSESHYLDREPIPPNAHMRTDATQSVNSVEACYSPASKRPEIKTQKEDTPRNLSTKAST